MTIAEVREKCKGLLARIPRDMLILAILVVSSSASFWLGYLTGLDVAGQTLNIMPDTTPLTKEPTDSPQASSGQVVASKSGTKYYFPSCAGANRISEANKVWFATPELATAAGYAPAANCK